MHHILVSFNTITNVNNYYPHDIEIGGSTYYQINIKLPLRSFTIKKRYLEFQQLVLDLSRNLGIDSRDFPYELPGKRINWLNKTSIVEERKVGLAEFLNNLIQDSTLQNEREVLSFCNCRLILDSPRICYRIIEQTWILCKITGTMCIVS